MFGLWQSKLYSEGKRSTRAAKKMCRNRCRNQTISAECVDEDVEEDMQSEGITYVWYQKRFCEKWPEVLDDCTIDMTK